MTVSWVQASMPCLLDLRRVVSLTYRHCPVSNQVKLGSLSLQFLLLGSQWGDDMKPPYPLFRTEAYWGTHQACCCPSSRLSLHQPGI